MMCARSVGSPGKKHPRPVRGQMERAGMEVYENRICGIVSASGRYGEPLACAFPLGHKGPHAWASLPTFVNGEPTPPSPLVGADDEHTPRGGA